MFSTHSGIARYADLFPSSRRPWAAIEIVLLATVVVAFCRPLFAHLDRTDFDNDESHYAYSTDRMLETGDWATPREPRTDTPSFDKPPLMMWLAAAGIGLGLFAHDEAAMRFWVALLGSGALIYLFLLGRRFVHPVAGFGAVLVLFVQPAFLVDHGLRVFGMDAAVVLATCGSLFHALAWSQAESPAARRWHPLAAATLFGIGFFAKFVAACFLPLIFLATAALVPAWRRRLHEDRRAWVAAAGVTLLWLVPWFGFQTWLHGSAFWRRMFMVLVVQRLVGVLEPSHLQAWHFYAAELYQGWRNDEILLLSLSGLVLWTWHAVRRRQPAALLVSVWLLLPIALMSAMTSKLAHYLHPERPAAALMAAYPLAVLGVGLGHLIDRVRSSVASRGGWPAWLRATGARLERRGVRRALDLLAGVALLAAAATLAWGMLRFDLGPLRFRSSSVARPLALALLFFGLARPLRVRSLVPLLPAALLLPWGGYAPAIRWTETTRDPMRATVACLAEQAAAHHAGGAPSLAVFLPPDTGLTSDWYYYFRRLGPVAHVAPRGSYERLYLQLFVPAAQTPVAVPETTYRDFLASLGDRRLQSRIRRLARRRGVAAELPRPLQAVTLPAGAEGTLMTLLLPGPYAVCAPVAVAHGAPPLRTTSLPAAAR